MTRENDNDMDARGYELERRISTNENDITNMKTTIETISNRQERHESRFEEAFERLTNGVSSIDTKIEVFIAQVTTKSSTWDNILKNGTPIVIAIVGSLWVYSTYIEDKTDKVKTEIVQQVGQVGLK
jgi:vesicle coat complex subunit